MASETDLVAAGYRDRVVTELAQNAADAAVRAGVSGKMAIWSDDEGVHVANVGAPLTTSGLQALCALRASDKSAGGTGRVGVTGRFGVGFTAVRALGDHIEFRSRTGSVVFDAERTRRVVAERGIAGSETGDVPVLRLAWPLETPPAPGWDSEVVIRGARLSAAETVREATDLLLELPALTTIVVESDEMARRTRPLWGGTEVAIGDERWWQYSTDAARWLVPVVDGVPRPVGRDVLRAPTRSDEVLGLPALVVTEVALQPDRRRILPGADIARVAAGYARMVRSLPPALRPALVPVPAIPAGEVDSILREAITADLRGAAWVPTARGVDAAPADARLLRDAPADVVEALSEVVPGLVVAECSGSGAAALTCAGVVTIGLADVAEALSGVSRDPSWWYALYDALEKMVRDSADAEEVAALPVPLTDGRTVTGPRTVSMLLQDSMIADVEVAWARLVHPAATHPLLARLGAREARPADLLADPALEALLEDPDGVPDAVVHDVLALAGVVGGEPMAPLGALPLPDANGDVRAADELVLPGSPLSSVIAADGPLGVVSAQMVDRFGVPALRTVGVLHTFALVNDESPTGPSHHLDDEESWWYSLEGEPDSVVAVRDLDLVDPPQWPRALTILLSEPRTARTLGDRNGYTAWWLRRHARIGERLGLLRAPGDETYGDLLDVLDHPRASELTALLAGPSVAADPALAAHLVRRLGDSSRKVAPAHGIRVHSLLARATSDGDLEVEDVDPPDHVRSVDGSVCPASEALVLDRPWYAAALDPARTVLGALDTAGALADLLDVRLASDVVVGEITSSGAVRAVDADPRLATVESLSGLRFPTREVVVHEHLTVRVVVDGVDTGERAVPFWIEAGRTHVGSTGGW